jgi:putative ABC transport system permease protein
MSLKISRRGLGRRKLRSGLTILAVVFAVSLLVGSNIVTNSIMGEVRNVITETQGDVQIGVTWATGAPFNAGNLSTVSSEQGVRAVSPRLGVSLHYLNGSLLAPVTLVGVNSTLDEAFGHSNVSLSLLTQTANSCIATEEVAENYNVTQGSTVIVSRGQTSSESSWELKVVAVAHIEGKGYSGVLLTDLSLAQEILGEPDKVNFIAVAVTNVENTAAVRDSLSGKLGSNFKVTAPAQNQLDQANSQLGAFGTAMTMIAIVSLAVACMLIMNSLLMTVNERKYEVGVLRSIGTPKGAIFRIFIAEALLFGVIGSIVGALVGIILSQFLFSYVANAMNDAMGGFTGSMVVSLDTLMSGIIAGLVVTALASLYPALSASRTKVVQAIRPQMRGGERRRLRTAVMGTLGALSLLLSYQLVSSNSALGMMVLMLVPAGLLLVTTSGIRGIAAVASCLFSPVLRGRRTIATRSISRNRRRSSLTISMIAVGIASAVLISGLSQSMMAGLTDFVDQKLSADIYLAPSEGSISVRYADDLAQIDGVKTVSYIAVQPALMVIPDTGEWKASPLFGIDTETFSEVYSVEFNSTKSPEEICAELGQSNTSMIMATGLAEELKVSAGDNVSVMVDGGKMVNFTVIALFYGSMFVAWNSVSESEMAMVGYEALVEYFPNEFGISRDASIFFLKVENGENANTVADRIRNSTNQKLWMQTGSDQRTMITTMFSKIFSLFQSLTIMAVGISLLGMTTTMIMSVLERKREVGILRAIGTSKTEVSGMIIGEALTLGVIGLILGVAMGQVFLIFLVGQMSQWAFPAPLIIPYTVILYLALASIGMSVASAAYPAYKASRMNVVDSIRYG